MHHHQKKPSMFKFHETSHPLRNGDQNFMGCKVKFRLIVINSWDDHGYTMVYKHEVFVITLSPLKIPTWFTFFRRERLKKSVTWQRQPMGGDGETNVLHTQTPWEVFKHQRLVKKKCSTMQLKLTSHTPSRYQIMCQCIITTAAITAI